MDSSASLSHHPKLIPKQCNIFLPADAAATGKYPSSRRRTPSFSSSSNSSLSPYNSSSSLESYYFANYDDTTLFSPPSPPFRFSGVPFSWEHLPGIPKKQTPLLAKKINSTKLHDQESSIKLLPLPPPTRNSSNYSHNYEKKKKKKNYKNSLQGDPFFAAMVECSKDINDNHHHHQEEEEEEEEEEEITGSTRNFRNNNDNNSKVSRSLSDRFGFINLYSSCKRASSVSESIIYLPTSRRRSNYHHFTRRSL